MFGQSQYDNNNLIFCVHMLVWLTSCLLCFSWLELKEDYLHFGNFDEKKSPNLRMMSDISEE